MASRKQTILENRSRVTKRLSFLYWSRFFETSEEACERMSERHNFLKHAFLQCTDLNFLITFGQRVLAAHNAVNDLLRSKGAHPGLVTLDDLASLDILQLVDESLYSLIGRFVGSYSNDQLIVMTAQFWVPEMSDDVLEARTVLRLVPFEGKFVSGVDLFSQVIRSRDVKNVEVTGYALLNDLLELAQMLKARNELQLQHAAARRSPPAVDLTGSDSQGGTPKTPGGNSQAGGTPETPGRYEGGFESQAAVVADDDVMMQEFFSIQMPMNVLHSPKDPEVPDSDLATLAAGAVFTPGTLGSLPSPGTFS
jgi:hypothetical protein